MTEETLTTPTTTTEAPSMNSDSARTSTGEIKDQSTDATPTPATEPAPTDAPVVPDQYEFTFPEGRSPDAAVLEGATPIFKELGLSQPQAQKLVDFYTKINDDSVAANMARIDAMRTEWRNQVSADKEIGGKLDSVKTEIGRALTHLPEDVQSAFREAMDVTGAGDHPGVVKAFYKLAQMVNEGSHVTGGGPSKHGQSPTGNTARPSLASSMYPNLPS